MFFSAPYKTSPGLTSGFQCRSSWSFLRGQLADRTRASDRLEPPTSPRKGRSALVSDVPRTDLVAQHGSQRPDLSFDVPRDPGMLGSRWGLELHVLPGARTNDHCRVKANRGVLYSMGNGRSPNASKGYRHSLTLVNLRHFATNRVLCASWRPSLIQRRREPCPPDHVRSPRGVQRAHG